MTELVEFGLFLFGFVFGLLYFGMILLPLFYGVPRASVWAFRGWVRARAPLHYLWDAVKWFMVLVGVLLLLEKFLPSVYTSLRDSSGFNWGSLVGMIFTAGYAIFHPSGRQSRREDFVDLMRKRYLTPVGATMVRLVAEQPPRREEN